MMEKAVYIQVMVMTLVPVILLGACGTPPPERRPVPAGPQWVYTPDSVYPEARFISAVGHGQDRESAEKNALGALAAVFGQTVQGETRASYRYSEAVNNGVIDVLENSGISGAVRTSFSVDTLIGAEIKDRWFDGETHYAIAVMERFRCAMLYSDLIESNQRSIGNLVPVSGDERYSFEGYARYDLAAVIADANHAFLNILSVLSPGSASALRHTLSRGDDYRLEGREIISHIPIAVSVDNDRAGRVKAAFSRVFSEAGYLTGGGDVRYVLEAELTLSEVDLPRNPDKFIRYVINASLRDTRNGGVLFPYTISGREGHASLSEAETRVLRIAENQIRQSFGEALTEYLSRLSLKVK
jgi:hypothetical protein